LVIQSNFSDGSLRLEEKLKEEHNICFNLTDNQGEFSCILGLGQAVKLHAMIFKFSGTIASVKKITVSDCDFVGTTYQLLYENEFPQSSSLYIPLNNKLITFLKITIAAMNFEQIQLQKLSIYAAKEEDIVKKILNNTEPKLNTVSFSETNKENPLCIYRQPLPKRIQLISDALLVTEQESLTQHQKILKYLDFIQNFKIGFTSDANITTLLKEKIGSCGTFSNIILSLAAFQNIKGRFINLHNYPVGQGHTVVEFFIDGKWCLYDPTYASYYTDTPEDTTSPNVLSFQDLQSGKGRNPDVSLIILNKIRYEATSPLSSEFALPDIYEKANPAGYLLPDSPMIFPLSLDAKDRNTVVSRDFGTVYQGASFLGVAFLNAMHLWKFTSLSSGLYYMFKLDIASLGGDFIDNISDFEAYAEITQGGHLIKRQHAKFTRQERQAPWKIYFKAQRKQAVIKLGHLERGPEFKYINIEKYTLKPLPVVRVTHFMKNATARFFIGNYASQRQHFQVQAQGFMPLYKVSGIKDCVLQNLKENPTEAPSISPSVTIAFSYFELLKHLELTWGIQGAPSCTIRIEETDHVGNVLHRILLINPAENEKKSFLKLPEVLTAQRVRISFDKASQKDRLHIHQLRLSIQRVSTPLRSILEDPSLENNQILWNKGDPENPLRLVDLSISKKISLVAKWLLGEEKNLSPHQKIIKFMNLLAHCRIGIASDNSLETLLTENVGACGSFSNMLLALAKTQGIQGRYVNLYNFPPNNGHTVVELFIDGKWSIYDPTYGAFYTDTPENPVKPNVLSFKELRRGDGQKPGVKLIINSQQRYESSFPLSKEFLGPEIYEKALPAGPLDSNHLFTFPLFLDLITKPTLLNSEIGPSYQGADYIGNSLIPQGQRWTLSSLQPGQRYLFTITPSNIVAPHTKGNKKNLLNFEAFVILHTGGILLQGASYKVQIRKKNKMAPEWKVLFEAQSTEVVIEILHPYKGQDRTYLLAENYRLQKVD
jgi:transglutaminase-like putative cysteine protease